MFGPSASTTPRRAGATARSSWMPSGALERAREDLGGAEDAEYVGVPGARPALSVQDMAREHDADLVVIGSTRRSAVGRVLGGNLLSGLLDEPVCPVCVAPRGGHARGAVRTAGVAVDGTVEADAALALAARLLGGADPSPEVEIVFVDDAPSDDAPDPRDEARRRDVSALLDAAAARLPDTLTVRELAVHGDPAETLTALSVDLDLLLVGHRPRGPIGELLHRSVSGRVAAHAACPVVIAPLVAQPRPAA